MRYEGQPTTSQTHARTCALTHRRLTKRTKKRKNERAKKPRSNDSLQALVCLRRWIVVKMQQLNRCGDARYTNAQPSGKQCPSHSRTYATVAVVSGPRACGKPPGHVRRACPWLLQGKLLLSWGWWWWRTLWPAVAILATHAAQESCCGAPRPRVNWLGTEPPGHYQDRAVHHCCRRAANATNDQQTDGRMGERVCTHARTHANSLLCAAATLLKEAAHKC